MNESKLRKIVREQIKRIDEVNVDPHSAMLIAKGMETSPEQLKYAIEIVAAAIASMGMSQVWGMIKKSLANQAHGKEKKQSLNK